MVGGVGVGGLGMGLQIAVGGLGMGVCNGFE